ncbi:MAG: biotin/lipoyl-binding protein [Deltaproteobacteria bacterium]|nr:biotin/lipoyl-binding protein [Deltaproteobacteria bacterium]
MKSKKFTATHDGKETPIEIGEIAPDSLRIVSNGKTWEVDVHIAGPNHYSVIHDGRSHDLRFHQSGPEIQAFLHGEHLYFQLDEEGKAGKPKPGAGRLLGGKPGGKIGGGATPTRGPFGAGEGKVELIAQMPGKIVSVAVKKGDKVEEGEGVVVLEAMKMENEMKSPKSGVVTDVRVAPGQSVENGALLVVIE